ncbi:hypothetical protein [Streptomyces sp. SGAir0957]
MSDDRNSRASAYRCQPLHTVYGLVALLAGAGVLLQQPVMLLFVFPLAVIAREVNRLVRTWTVSGPAGETEVEVEVVLKTGSAFARRVWGVAAGLLDALLVVTAFAVCAVLLRGDGAVLVPRGSAADYLALAGAAVFIAAHAYTHLKAAGPARTDA